MSRNFLFQLCPFIIKFFITILAAILSFKYKMNVVNG